MLRASFLGAAAIMGLALYSGGEVRTIANSIPRTILDWSAPGNDTVYDRRTIYDYLDGGAEVYLAFDFQSALARKYAGPSGDEIALDVYDMGSSSEAFGVFSCDRVDEDAGIGQESEYGSGLLRFWQGRYFVSITALGDEKASEKAILALGKAAVQALGPAGPLPVLLDLLPARGLVHAKTSYFHSSINLNNRYFVAGENILGLDKGNTDCAFAEYEAGGEATGKLLLVRYRDGASAADALKSFLAAYLPEAGPGGTARTEGRLWVSARRSADLVIIVFEAPSPKWAEDLAASVAAAGK